MFSINGEYYLNTPTKHFEGPDSCSLNGTLQFARMVALIYCRSPLPKFQSALTDKGCRLFRSSGHGGAQDRNSVVGASGNNIYP
ncbi:hypothetical protein V6N12_026258 [Hibiscus sabdariffa]|uniref:Uncharacterized protein n=1 Tax=Hibiscus sabdariffa TaxID=183260 RepID=A0ABR2DRA8_9ROSI